jgi:ubiquitin C-terminal hydrolase
MNIFGIPNIGNSCYLNSAIQCFIHLPLVLDSGNEFNDIMIDFCHKYFSREPSCFDSVPKIIKLLQQSQKDFAFMRQCDAQEAFFYLLDMYHENTKRQWSKKNNFFKNFNEEEAIREWKLYSPHYSLISDLCTLQMKESIYCHSCNMIIQKRFPLHIHLDITESEINLLNDGKVEEKLSDYKCEKCNEKKCTKSKEWYYFPEYLIMFNKKMNFFLKPSIILIKQSTNEKIHYELNMTINHLPRYNHYIAYLKSNTEDLWYECDDERIKKVNNYKINTIYLYVYKKVNK